MTTKHTKGPWTLHGEPESIRIEGPRDGNSHLVLVERVGGRRRGPGYNDLSELVANAKLMAASPLLLAAAVRVLEKLDHPINCVNDFDAEALRKAIAAATA